MTAALRLVEIDVRQLRHTHATEPIEAVRRRLGHASTETTQLYALLDARSPMPRSAPPTDTAAK
ncbi:hypothetical protein [Nonomuraea sp. KM90]|uniref:hypothetical protein n=1 Tax=Nonomuraea sp. KM90 TaxID=3457428 RepID=UPI003FCDB1A6